MKKNLYLWIFLVVSFLVGAVLWIAQKNLNNDSLDAVGEVQINSATNGNVNVEPEKIDLTQENVDFERDPDDMREDLDGTEGLNNIPNLDSIEEEVY